jgi:hypothetical protein
MLVTAKSCSLAQNVPTSRMLRIRGLAMMRVGSPTQISEPVGECDLIAANIPASIAESLGFYFPDHGLENRFKPRDKGLATDEFDEHARRVLLIHRASDEPTGKVHAILPSDED